jgi:hypothetical protein
MTATLDLDAIDIYSPDNYVDAPPHEVFEYLRREQPVYRQAMPDGTSYWAILKHADLVEVSRTSRPSASSRRATCS